MKRGTIIKLIIAAIAAFAVSFLLCHAIFGSLESYEEHLRRDKVEYFAENMLKELSTSLESYERIPQVWSGVVRAGNGNVSAFEEISQELYEKNPTINAIQLAPDGVVQYCYPKNNDIIDYDIMEEDIHSDDAKEVMKTGNAVISGPVELEQGGDGLIIRYPIYIDDEFWGFSTIVINTPEVFEDSGFGTLSEEGYLYRLTKEDNDEMISVTSGNELPSDAVIADTEIGQRTWVLEMEPAEGWLSASAKSGYRVLSYLISLMAAAGAALIMMLILRNKELEEMRGDLNIQIKALAASEKANKLQTKALEASKKANDMQAEALEASRRANQAQVEALEMARKENVRQAKALKESEAANRAKTEFISRISHDIRTPIGAIQNLTKFALQDLDDKEKLKSDLEKIETSNQFLLSLISDVLDISRVDSGKIELKPEPYPYDEYETNIRNIMEPMCSEKGLGFEMVCENEDEEHGVIIADKIRINQIALNILSNAVKYTPEGGYVRYISQSRNMKNGKIVFAFTVEDNGIGMSEDFQKKMFEEFAQEYDNPGRESGMTGTGLGLAIVKRLIDIMNGEISVKSETGKGTAVSVQIVFPDAMADEEYARSVKAKEAEKADKMKFSGHVLLAEDNEINQAIALRIFEECGLSADLACDGKEAVEMFSGKPEGTYDAIFMDIQMPNMNGYEATRAIRKLAGTEAKTIPIVAMTADAFDAAMKMANEAGMDEYVTKPLNVDYIRQIMVKIGLKTD